MNFEVKSLFNNGSKFNYLLINPYPMEIDEEMLNYLRFNVKTYSKLSTTESAQDKLKPIPDFINRLSEKNQRILIEMFIEIKKHILSNKEDTIEKTAVAVGNIVFDYFTKMDMIPKLKKYVIDNKVPIPDLSKIGKRPQDDKKTTFYHDEYIDLTTIALMCKLLSGVFGEIVFLVSNVNSLIDNSLKEIYAIFVIKKILDKYYKNLINKLMFYIETYAKKVKYDEDIN